MRNLFNLVLLISFLLFGCEKDDESTKMIDIVALEATNITSYGFQANWQAIEMAETYDLEVASDQDFTNIVRTIQLTGASHNMYNFTGLNESLNYFFRLKYYVAGNSSNYSNVIAVTTYKTITALEATNITQTGFQANWSIVDGVDKYEIEIATDTEFSIIIRTSQIEGATNDSIIITDLDKDVTYNYRLKYIEGEKVSHPSNVIAVTTNYVEFKTITALEASNIGIYGFQANWELVEGAESYNIEISDESNFTNIVQNTLVQQGTDSLIIEDLEKDKKYYYRVKYNVWDKTSDYSNIIDVTTNYFNEDLTIITNDILTKATITYKMDYTGQVPVIIFLHMGSANRYEWTNNELYNMCVDSGYVAFAYDLRGHGESEGTIDWSTFTTDPNILPKDLDVIITYLQNLDFIDPNRIGMVGGSMGAILATGASQYDEVRVVVALTSFYDAVEDLYGVNDLNTIYYMAGEYDNASESQKLFDVTKDPKKIDIIEGSTNHSAALINTDELRKNVFDWIKSYL